MTIFRTLNSLGTPNHVLPHSCVYKETKNHAKVEVKYAKDRQRSFRQRQRLTTAETIIGVNNVTRHTHERKTKTRLFARPYNICTAFPEIKLIYKTKFKKIQTNLKEKRISPNEIT